MTDLFIKDPAFKMLEKSLGVSAIRHRTLANNIANVNTVGYKPMDIDFQKALQDALGTGGKSIQRTHPKHLVPSATYETADTTGSESVDIDTEMTHLVENNLKYRTSIEMLLRKMTILKHAITEGGR